METAKKRTKEDAKRHKQFMKSLETARHKAELSLDTMLDTQNDVEYARQIACHRGGYQPQQSW